MTLAFLSLLIFGPAAHDPADASPTGEPMEGQTLPAPDTNAPGPDGEQRNLAPNAVPALPLAAVQCLGGCAVLFASVPLAFVCTTATCVGAPFVVGYFETWIGDRFGAGRAPAMAPIVTAYIGATSAAVLGAVVYGIGMANGAPLGLIAPAALASAGAVLALTAGAVPLAYALAATPKHELDDGSEPPDFFAPRVPHEAKRREQRKDRESRGP